MNLVEVEYFDGNEFPGEDTVLWEREIGAEVLKGGGLPRIGDGIQPDHPDRFAAFCDAIRWSSVARLPGLTGDDIPLVSPWESAVMPEPYQLYPVLKALEMPRVSLLLADDVGLGKTIEAGLILRELLQRRRIRRVLVICPASLQLQWRDELRSKFALDFTVLNRDRTTEIQREYGMDANPWTVTPRVITSMDFLRQPDVLADFLAGSERLERGHALAWDLLVVDEAHNLAPLGFGERSDRSRMLVDVAYHCGAPALPLGDAAQRVHVQLLRPPRGARPRALPAGGPALGRRARPGGARDGAATQVRAESPGEGRR